jgi:hypothetical protein
VSERHITGIATKYDDWDARNRIEQMVEWAEGEEDPDSREIPKLEQDLPECLRSRESSECSPSLDSFPVPAIPWLKTSSK